MKLSSVREVKVSLTSQLSDVIRGQAKTISSYGFAARNVRDVEKVHRTIALGVHPLGGGNYKLAVRIQRRGLEESTHLASIREAARGEVDIRYIGRVTKLTGTFFTARHRPLRIGTSIGHYSITAGTLGCFAKVKPSGAARLISNNHVLADENRAHKGDAIIQPGAYDGGKGPKDAIGKLDRFVRLSTSKANTVDCALATIDPDVGYEATALQRTTPLQGISRTPLEGHERVEKLGRTTGHTKGLVTAFELDNVVVGYDIGNIRFDNQIEIEGAGSASFSQGGDSGSLIFTAGDHLALALLFAGGDQGGANGKGLTYANPLLTVLTELKTELLV